MSKNSYKFIPLHTSSDHNTLLAGFHHYNNDKLKYQSTNQRPLHPCILFQSDIYFPVRHYQEWRWPGLKYGRSKSWSNRTMKHSPVFKSSLKDFFIFMLAHEHHMHNQSRSIYYRHAFVRLTGREHFIQSSLEKRTM